MALKTVSLAEFHGLVGTKFEPGPWLTIETIVAQPGRGPKP